MGKVQITVEEAVDTLKRSSLPTVITEGSDDYIVFRRMEERFRDIGLSLLPVGGRESVLAVLERRHEIKGVTVAFIVDRDMWLFRGVPEEYRCNELLITDGYSIENDLYRDGEFENLLDPEERCRFERDCREILRWYSFAVSECLDGGAPLLDVHPDEIIDSHGVIKADFARKAGYTGYKQDLFDQLASDYKRMLRGKTLLATLVRHLSYGGRVARHNHKSLMEAASVRSGPHMERFYQGIADIFGVAAPGV